jgi:primary-amine oxidase
MKKRRGSQLGGQDRLSNWEYVYMSGGSKLLAGAITYPYQPIRARMQQYNAAQQYSGLADVLRVRVGSWLLVGGLQVLTWLQSYS